MTVTVPLITVPSNNSLNFTTINNVAIPESGSREHLRNVGTHTPVYNVSDSRRLEIFTNTSDKTSGLGLRTASTASRIIMTALMYACIVTISRF